MRTFHFISIVVGLTFVLGCGEDEAPAPARVSPEPTASSESTEEPVARPEPSRTPEPIAEEPQPAAPETDRPIPASPPLPAPSSDPNRAHVFAVSNDEDQDFGAEDDLSEEDLRVGERLFIPEAAQRPEEDVVIPYPLRSDNEVQLEIKYPSFRYPDARLTRLVNERVRSFARAQASTRAPGVECTGTATLHFVSIGCSMHKVSERSSFDVEAVSYSALTLGIENGELRPMTLADAFVPGADLPALLAQGCEREVGEEELEGIDCRARPEFLANASFGSVGIVVSIDDNSSEWTQPGSFQVPYDSLAGHIVARGPLAESLYRRRATTREIRIDPSRRAPSPPSRSVSAIGRMSSPADAAALWSRLAAPQRDTLQFLDGYLIAPSADAARAAATALSLSAREVQVSTTASPLALRALQVTRETPLRIDSRRTAPIARTLPRGTLVIGSGDPIDGHTRVFANANADGYVDVRALGPADPCSPDPAPALASVPESSRASAAATTLRVLTRQAGGARAIFATELGSTIHIELHRVSDACVAERAITRFDRPGARLTYLGLSHTERRAGQALIVTLDDGEPAEVAVHSYDGGRPLFSSRLGEGQRIGSGRSEGEAWYPLVVLDAEGEQVGAFTWTGTTLAPATPP